MARILRFPNYVWVSPCPRPKAVWIDAERWKGFLEGTKKLAELLRE